MKYDEQYSLWKGRVEAELARRMELSAAPQPLRDAMGYSLLDGGKRLRPVLLLAACDAGGGDIARALPYACALEMIHTYSLVHDDLPAMDNDDLRRGRPTNHRVYGEGMAILAGDGLLTLAFETMLGVAKDSADIAAMRAISRAAGAEGMVGGQCVDLRSENEGLRDGETLDYIHTHKTGDLFVAAVLAGLHTARASQAMLRAGERFARALGLAFQIQDDLLDVQGDEQALGKATGADAARGKLTWPALHGVEAAQAEMRAQTQAAVDAAAKFGAAGWFLREMAERLQVRDR